MSRTRVNALALVNWKGVFYERYLLDRHVTALEGANGAGKTTVMIAAYVVLLPDMSRLRFTNLGETGASGGDRGIWGRLGEPGRPSYAALDLTTADGARLIAGVRLARKGEPMVEPTPFTIAGLPDDAPLQELLLVRRGDEDHVPELDELRASAVRLGGAIDVHRSARDYFAALFDRGVTPLRMASDEDRGKLNEMLRTSMTGGISRALTSELRSFLLKQETGLADTLTRVRANLDACRRTRTEVAEARVLERDISGVYDAGQSMFAGITLAVRQAARERRGRLDAARDARDAALRELASLESAVAGHAARQRAASERLASARAALDALTAARERARRADELAERLAALDAELAARSTTADAARAALATTDAERAARRRARDAAQDAYDRAAAGLAHLQDGLDELHRRAHAHRHARRRLADAREALADPALTIAVAAAALAEVTAHRAELDAERARADRDARDAVARRDDRARAEAALAAIAEALHEPCAPRIETSARAAHATRPPVPFAGGGRPTHAPRDLHASARAALAALDSREALATRTAELEREHRDAAALAARQHAARERAEAIGLSAGVPGAADAVAARLDDAERGWTTAEDQARHHAACAEDRDRDRAAAVAERAALETRATRWARCAEAVGRLAAAMGAAVEAASIAALYRRLADDLAAVAAERAALAAEREAALARAHELDTGGGAIAPALLRLRDELGGELVAGRFEDLDGDDAARVEAELGPLAGAIVVDDPDAAVRALVGRELDGELYLIAAGTTIEPRAAPAGAPAGVAVVRDGRAVRVTPWPRRPTLGRRAREREAAALRDRAEVIASELDDSLARQQALTGLRRDTALLADEREALVAGDPAEPLQAAMRAADRAADEAAAHREQAAAARERAAASRAELEVLRRLLGEALLLDPPDHDERARSLAADLHRAADAAELLAQLAPARRALLAHLDALRGPTPADPAALAIRLAALDDERDRLFRAAAALEDVLAHGHTEGGADAEAALAERSALVPALEAQHAAARAAARAAADAVTEADAAWERATAASQDAEAHRAASDALRSRLAEELAASRGDADDERATDEAVAAAEQRVAGLDGAVLAIVEQGARDRERFGQAERRRDDATAAVRAEERLTGPAELAWSALRDACGDDGLLAGALSSPLARAQPTAAELAAEATSKRELLLDRLRRARGGEALAEAVATLDPGAGADAVAVWREVRHWLRLRVPTQVAQTGEPLLALERLRDHLSVLESRLGRQESDLRGASSDIARGIEVQLRRAGWQVRRLNQHLEGISFGSIRAIRVTVGRVERMEQILRALREGEAQELLFQASLPIEDALDEVFRRYGGGRTGGQRLLDYREYLELAVEIQRRAGTGWEPASPTKLSTGEAIGVGAALMMVVLTEWERDANLLRSRRDGGSMRFLFLDEANRLSRDNLAVLFDLCHTLDLQLLIAAPEVAQAHGNTTYRLIRRVTDDGREEVLVSGRRATSAEDATPTATTCLTG